MFYKNQLSNLARLSGMKVAVLSLSAALFAMGCGGEDKEGGKTDADVEAAKKAGRAAGIREALGKTRKEQTDRILGDAMTNLGLWRGVVDTPTFVTTINAINGSSVKTMDKGAFKAIMFKNGDHSQGPKEGTSIPTKGALADLIVDETSAKKIANGEQKEHFMVALGGAILVHKVYTLFQDIDKYDATKVDSAIAEFEALKKKEQKFALDATSGVFSSTDSDPVDHLGSGMDTKKEVHKDVSDAMDTFVVKVKKVKSEYETNRALILSISDDNTGKSSKSTT